MAVELNQVSRPKGRTSRWVFRVTVGGVVIFESNWVSIRYATRTDAEWLAGVIDRLATREAFTGCPGHPGQVQPLLWWGDLGTDHGATIGDVCCHAEHLFGPVRGGGWYCQVSRDGEQFFHTADSGVQPRSGPAAWWLCEVVLSAVLAGVWERPEVGHR